MELQDSINRLKEKETTFKHKEKTLSLSTLKVEIKAIRVDNKAMTISLFNQIPDYSEEMYCLTSEEEDSHDPRGYEPWYKDVLLIKEDIQQVLGSVNRKDGIWFLIVSKTKGFVKVNTHNLYSSVESSINEFAKCVHLLWKIDNKKLSCKEENNIWKYGFSDEIEQIVKDSRKHIPYTEEQKKVIIKEFNCKKRLLNLYEKYEKDCYKNLTAFKNAPHIYIAV